MRTPDGIDSRDWEHVKELAIGVLGSLSNPEEEKLSRDELLRYLTTLEAKYGRLPSILATRADFVDDFGLKERLLQEAYASAAASGDMHNRLHVAHSLAEFYIEEMMNVTEGREWLAKLEVHLREVDDSTYSKDVRTLGRKLRELDPDNAS